MVGGAPSRGGWRVTETVAQQTVAVYMSVSETVAVAVFILTVAVADSRARCKQKTECERLAVPCARPSLPDAHFGTGSSSAPVYFYYALAEAYYVMYTSISTHTNRHLLSCPSSHRPFAHEDGHVTSKKHLASGHLFFFSNKKLKTFSRKTLYNF